MGASPAPARMRKLRGVGSILRTDRARKKEALIMISRMFQKKPTAPQRRRAAREMGKGGYVFIGLLIAAFVVLVIVFAFQTYGLVSGLFPADNVFMQGVTVFSFDG